MKKHESVIATIRKGSRKAVVLTVSERDHQPCLDIRQHEPDGLRELQPTRSGIGNIDRDMARDLVAGLLKFIAGGVA